MPLSISGIPRCYGGSSLADCCHLSIFHCDNLRVRTGPDTGVGNIQIGSVNHPELLLSLLFQRQLFWNHLNRRLPALNGKNDRKVLWPIVDSNLLHTALVIFGSLQQILPVRQIEHGLSRLIRILDLTFSKVTLFIAPRHKLDRIILLVKQPNRHIRQRIFLRIQRSDLHAIDLVRTFGKPKFIFVHAIEEIAELPRFSEIANRLFFAKNLVRQTDFQ